MNKVTIRLPPHMVGEIKTMVSAGKFANQSDAIRYAVRKMIVEEQHTQYVGDESTE